MRTLYLILLLVFTNDLKAQNADTNLVYTHLDSIIHLYPNRNCNNLQSLNGVATYIHKVFSKYGDSTHYQEYVVKKNSYKNVITSFGPKGAKRLIIGAHYDVCGNQDGADDNASGVVGLLEIARLLDTANLNIRIDLVAYTLEEPPYFRTISMGSYQHAKYLVDNQIDVLGMICLEMIGFYSDEKKSQKYPLKILKLIYGNKGDYITIVRQLNSGQVPKIFTKVFKRNELVKTKSFAAPASLTGIDFSDHLNYWYFNIPAVMITNTGFYRNYNYHKTSDTIETLDINRMTNVIQQLYETLLELDHHQKFLSAKAS